jgi:hypothetical protein
VSVGLSGNLRDFGIADVFQLIGQQRKTGVLELKSSKRRVQLVFDSGRVVTAGPAAGREMDLDPLGDMMVRCGLLTRERAIQAQSSCRSSARTIAQTVADSGWVHAVDVARVQDLLTRDTIFEVLRWTSGSFDFRAQDVSHTREEKDLLGAEQILMDGLRMVDEWQSFAERVPSESLVFERVGSFETFRDRSGTVSADQLECARRVLGLVDGRLSVRRIIDLARLGTFDGTRALADLRGTDVIRPAPSEGVRTLRRHAAALRSPRVAGRGMLKAVGTLTPLLVLCAVALSTHGPAPAPEMPSVEGQSLARLREDYATRRVRHAIDAYRITTGRWPESLEALAHGGYVDGEVLAAPEGRPYYSAHRDAGVVFLAPER